MAIVIIIIIIKAISHLTGAISLLKFGKVLHLADTVFFLVTQA